jgi:hypothetical protein
MHGSWWAGRGWVFGWPGEGLDWVVQVAVCIGLAAWEMVAMTWPVVLEAVVWHLLAGLQRVLLDPGCWHAAVCQQRHGRCRHASSWCVGEGLGLLLLAFGTPLRSAFVWRYCGALLLYSGQLCACVHLCASLCDGAEALIVPSVWYGITNGMCSPRLHMVLTSSHQHHASTHTSNLCSTGVSPFDAMITGCWQVPCAVFLDAVRLLVLEPMLLCVGE